MIPLQTHENIHKSNEQQSIDLLRPVGVRQKHDSQPYSWNIQGSDGVLDLRHLKGSARRRAGRHLPDLWDYYSYYKVLKACYFNF